MNQIFSAEEANNKITKCDCGKDKEGWQTHCIDCYKKQTGNNREEAMRFGQAINLTQNEFLKQGIDPIQSYNQFKERVKEYKKLIDEIQI